MEYRAGNPRLASLPGCNFSGDESRRMVFCTHLVGGLVTHSALGHEAGAGQAGGDCAAAW